MLAWTSQLGSAGVRPTRDNPDRVDDARYVAEQRQQNVEPELSAKSDGKQHADRREQYGEEDAKKVAHRVRSTTAETSVNGVTTDLLHLHPCSRDGLERTCGPLAH